MTQRYLYLITNNLTLPQVSLNTLLRNSGFTMLDVFDNNVDRLFATVFIMALIRREEFRFAKWTCVQNEFEDPVPTAAPLSAVVHLATYLEMRVGVVLLEIRYFYISRKREREYTRAHTNEYVSHLMHASSRARKQMHK